MENEWNTINHAGGRLTQHRHPAPPLGQHLTPRPPLSVLLVLSTGARRSWLTLIVRMVLPSLLAQEGGQRGAVQVLSCSLFATVLAVAHRYLTGVGDSLVDCKAQPLGGALLCAYLGFYACCAGDTW